MSQNPHVLLTFDKVHNPLRLPREATSEPPKVVRTPSVFNILTSTCASRHNGVHFFDIGTSKSGANMLCFVHFHFDMCFAPQPRALFRHQNFQKWSERGVFCTFSLRNVLRATTACTFPTSELSKVARTCGVLYIFTSKCASRHNGVHFFDISTSKSGPAMVCFVHFHLQMCFAPQPHALFRHRNFQKCSDTQVFCTFWLANVLCATTACNFSSLIWPAGSAPRRFSEPTFRPSGATNHWKNTVFRDFPTFSRICIFFLLTLSLLLFFLLVFLFSLPLPCSAFHLSILSEVWLLNFLRQLYIYGAAAIILNPSSVPDCFTPSSAGRWHVLRYAEWSHTEHPREEPLPRRGFCFSIHCPMYCDALTNISKHDHGAILIPVLRTVALVVKL